ncbi:ABC transporter permease [Microbulbifer sp.]|uniref:ABC transporter permease n=1 Tax=Microbulbifer sp. TaxID=1908541 RepID=UPI00258D57C1|nr:ABC transporter permease [Microbulbifer sp.]
MTGFGATIRRELRAWHTEKTTHWLMLWLPVLACFLLIVIFSARTITGLPISIVDQDSSAITRQLSAQLNAAPAISVKQTVASMDAAKTRMEKGETYAIVSFPSGFSRDIVRGRQPTVALLLNEQSLATADAISSDVQEVILTQIGVESVTMRMAQGTPMLQAEAMAQRIRTQTHPLYNPGLDYAAYLGIALIAASLHCFVVLHGARCIAGEDKQWLYATGWGALWGKLTAAFVWWVAIGIGCLLICFSWLDLPPMSEPFWFVVGWAALVAAYLGLGSSLAMAFPSHVAYSCVSVLAGPAVAFSGVTFPQGAMPVAARLFGEALPVTWFLHLQTQFVTERVRVEFAIPQLQHLLGFACVFLFFSAALFYWRTRKLR